MTPDPTQARPHAPRRLAWRCSSCGRCEVDGPKSGPDCVCGAEAEPVLMAQDEIAEAVGLSAPQITEITKEFGIGNLAKTESAAADHATDHTQDEIAEAVGWPQQSVADWLSGIAGNPESGESGNTDDSDSAFTLSKSELADAPGGRP